MTALVTTEVRSQKLREREILEGAEVGKWLLRDTGLCLFNFMISKKYEIETLLIVEGFKSSFVLPLSVPMKPLSRKKFILGRMRRRQLYLAK